MDQAFAQVIDNCSLPRRDQGGTWITADMKAAYIELHRRRYAHSLEIWRQGELVGGIYGVAIGQSFFGESMFSKADNASKVALVYLAGQLKQWGFGFIDCQMVTQHLITMGAKTITRPHFQRLLMHYTKGNSTPSPWRLSWAYSEG